MKILHISLIRQGSDYARLRYFWDNPNNYKEKILPLAEIKGLNDKAETDYYTRFPVEYATTGQALYNWLDTNDRILANNLIETHPEGLIIAIATDKGLPHSPWELLHDGHTFLVERQPPIIPVRWVSPSKPIEVVDKPQNRPLNVLFMATSPLNVEPELDYEAEEGRILTATQRIPLNLRVEESGYLTELDYLVGEYEKNYFDVFHLTGHATHKERKPCFLTEDEYGGLVYSNTSEIAKALRSPLPPLIFLSGCRTGYGSDGVLPSMAEELLNLGNTAVLGWGQNVRDTDATAAASRLYRELSQGETVAKAIASTYKALINENAQDWHKLRLYVGRSLPQALVTPLRTRGRKQLPKPTTTIEFRDEEKRLRVASREEFVGRRRQLQNCLRTFKTDFEKVGVLIHGMGGWGKSSIASRHCLVYEIPVPMTALEVVCESLPNYQQQLQRGLDLGLIEMSPEPKEKDRVYRISRILPHVIANIKLPEAPDVYCLYRKAYEKLNRLWENTTNRSEEQWREIFRLLFSDKENTERFRQGFSQMLAVQFNSESDRALESEMRKLKAELPKENFCRQLEDYLSREEWRKADEETAWLFYSVMIQGDYEDWYQLCREFPDTTLKNIDQLWVEYSKGDFGFSTQKEIWESLGATPNGDYNTWKTFEQKLQWDAEIISDYPRGYFPTQYAKRSSVRGGIGDFSCSGGFGGWNVVCWDGVLSLLENIIKHQVYKPGVDPYAPVFEESDWEMLTDSSTML